MTDSELEELLSDCPSLYHMAERGSWPSIKSYGLLSTSGLLDSYEVTNPPRQQIESERRASSVTLSKKGRVSAVVRDQLPMDDNGLERCLLDGLKPEDWYKLLNSKVFFWLSRDRLVRLLKAGTYREQEHDVLELDSKALVAAHAASIWLCAINSGCTKPFPHPRGKDTFSRLADYPYADWKTKRKRGERAVELAVDYAVVDVAKYVKRVVRMKGNEELSTIFES